MAKSNPTRPAAPADESSLGDGTPVPDTRPPLKDPRAVSALDNLGVERPGDLLSFELDESIGDEGWGRDFARDVRSDSYDDERHERR